MIHNTVYKISNGINGKIYIGVHSTNNLNDNYFCSGLVILRAIKKYGIENFKREILFDFDNRTDMLKMERLLVDELFTRQSDTYNLKRGGLGGAAFGRTLSSEQRLAISNRNKGKKPSALAIQRANESGKSRGMKLTEEHKEKIRQANIISWSNPELRKKLGESRIGNQWAKGYKMTDEQKKKMSQSKIGKKGPKQSDEVKQKHAEATRKAWENPEHKEMRRKAIKDSWTPERRAAQAIITRERNLKRYGNLERVE